MPNIHVQREIKIELEIEPIRAILLDFKLWPIWSPWLIQEPECKVEHSEDGKSYTWEGSRVGVGSMRIVNIGDEELKYELNFIKPWKSTACVTFSLESDGSATRVFWTMESSLPFFMFWMKKMMEAFVGMDYERGLGMLKAYAELGEVPSKLDFMGPINYEGCSYIGIKNSCSVAAIGKKMESDCQQLINYMGSLDENLSDGPMFSIYHKYDPVKDSVEYTIALPCKKNPPALKLPFISGSLPKLRAYKLAHIGAYEFLGNAWSTLYSMERAKEFKCSKASHPFEVYLNSPDEVEPADLRTEIYFPIK